MQRQIGRGQSLTHETQLLFFGLPLVAAVASRFSQPPPVAKLNQQNLQLSERIAPA
jgi:hypothetical protein